MLRHSGQAKRRSGTHAVGGGEANLVQDAASGWRAGWPFCTGQLAASAIGMGSGSATPSGMTKPIGFRAKNPTQRSLQ
jgi:hypothetical protein